MLEESITKYEKRAYDTVEFITALIQLAKELREAERRGEKLNLSIEELAFYDALETNDSAVKILGDEVLRNLAIEIAENVKKNKSIDWVMREPARAKMRVAIKRVLRKNGYPPDQQEKAIQTIIEQAELGLS
jgi:type I restriction enzyme R subunit